MSGQHSVEAAKKIQRIINWEDPNGQNDKLKIWKALTMRSNNETKMNDVFMYFNLGSKKRAY